MANKPVFKRVGQKLNLDIRQGLLEKEGDSLAAVYLATIFGTKLDKQTGEERELNKLVLLDPTTGDREERELNKLVLLDPTTGDRYMIFQDAGIKKAMEGSVDVGDFIELVYMGTKDIGNGKRLNTYDIFQLEKTAEVVAAIRASRPVTGANLTAPSAAVGGVNSAHA